MTQDACGLAPVPNGGKSRLCPLRTAIAAPPSVDAYDDFCRVTLALFRFIGAAYATGAADCWEAAYRFADEAPGIADRPLLVARAAALVRLVRTGRPCDLCFMPPSCRRLSKDEAELMRLLAVARSKRLDELEAVVREFVGDGSEMAMTRAVNALACC